MRQLTPKRLTAWLLTLVMALSLLPAAALADEADEDLSPPAPQEDYGYVRLVFAEGEQLDLYHGEYITECSPTAAVHDGADEDFLTDGDYLALYYEGRLYHKATLDGVSIDADAVLPAEDFALVPMGKLAAQEPPSGAEPEALTTEGINEQPKPQPEPEPQPENEDPEEVREEQTVSQPAMLAEGSDAFGEARLTFTKDSVGSGNQVIKLKGYQYITECTPNAEVYTVPELETQDFKDTGNYVAYMYGSRLYLKGDLNGACIDLQYVDSPGTVDVFVQDDTTMSGNHCLLYNFRNSIDLHILPGKTLNLNLERPGTFRYTGAIRTQEGGDVTITGGGTLNINFNGDPAVENGIPVSGINAGDVTLEYRKYSAFIGSPTVNINMNNGGSGPEGDAVTGIKAGKLTVKDDAKLNIEVSGRNVKSSGESDSNGRVNRAISASSMELLDNASVDITSYKNVVTDIYLFGGGDALTVNTTGHLNIKNQSIVTFADKSDDWNRRFGYPSSNIYLKEKNATFKLEKAEGGVSIDSYSSDVDNWYTSGTFDLDWYWPVHGNITRGPNMYRGNHRVDQQIKLSSNSYLYTWGFAQYIYSPNGVATVKQSPGLTMDSHAPEDNPHGSQLYYAEVIEPTFNLTYIVRKGESIELTTGGRNGTFLYWYDALRPEVAENGTGWTNVTQTFTNIQQDMVLVPVRDPMKNGPTLSDVGYKEQWDTSIGTNIRYAYQDMTFEKADDISTRGGYEVMLVPAQLPRYGEKTYAAKNLSGSPLMGLRSARLYADKKAYGSTDELDNNHYSIQTGRYRIAYKDDDTGRCFFSKPFTFNPPVAPPYIDPVTQIFDTNDGGTKTVKITAEREAPIKYCLWDYTKNKWGPLQDYTGPFEVTVTPEQDVRIEAYAGPLTLDRRSEVRYAVRPTDKPTVKYGDKDIGDNVGRYFYDSIELTVEAPEGYEVWYQVGEQPYESDGEIVGTKVEGGKVTITDSGSHGILYFKLAKVVTVGGREYRKLSHQYTSVHLSKLETLPAPKVTVKTKEGGQTLIPSGNTYTMTENVVTVELGSNGNWPLNATIAYDTNGNASPRLSQSYTKPFEVRGAGTLAVFTLVPKADGGYEYTRTAYTFKLAESLETVTVSVFRGDCTAYYTKEDGSEGTISADDLGRALKVGTRVRVVPNAPSGQVFKKWEISNYEEWHIWGTYGVGDYYYSPELVFYVPKPQYSSPTQTKTLSIEATFASAAEANISGQTLVGLDMSKTVGESISLWYTTKDIRTISCQWWVGDRAGTEDSALPGAVKFDPDKTYTVKVTIKTNPGASFASSAGVAIGGSGGHFTVPSNKITRTGKDTLTFTATPIRQIDLTMPAPLTVGDPLPTAAQIGGLPEGVTIQKLEWPYTTGTTVPDDDSVRAALTLKTDGTHPILTREYPKPTVNGEQRMYTRNSSNDDVTDGSTVMLGSIDLPVKSKGVAVSGTVKSYNPNNPVTVQLIEQGHHEVAYETTIAADSGSGQAEQNFSFNAVAAGTYDLVVTKDAHLTYTVKGVVVGDGPLDLTKHSNAAISTITLLCGDINGDGSINEDDVSIIRYANNINKSTADADNKLADINGDGSVNEDDVSIVRYSSHINKGVTACTYDF